MTGEPLWAHKEKRDWEITSLAFSGDGRFLLSTVSHGFWGVNQPPPGTPAGIHLFDIASGKKDLNFAKINSFIFSAVFSPDSKFIVGATHEGLQFLDVDTGKNAFTLKN